jgi:invasion protein IalB
MRAWPAGRSNPTGRGTPNVSWERHVTGTEEAGDAGTPAGLGTSLRRLLAALAIGGVALLAAGHATLAQEGTVKAQHGDWQIVCKPPPPGAKNEACALVQSVTAEDRNNVGLTVYFQKFSNGTRVLRVFAPLGVLLPPGLGLKIDNKDVGNAPFLRCHNFACYAQVVVEDKLVEQLKAGKTAVFIIFQSEEAGIGIPISLAGFDKALAALK